ncbi:MAG: hypothetical protein ABEJ34_00420 [Haloferacaceae archaeon]
MDGLTSEPGTTTDEVAADAVFTPAVDFFLLLCLVTGVAAALVILL